MDLKIPFKVKVKYLLNHEDHFEGKAVFHGNEYSLIIEAQTEQKIMESVQSFKREKTLIIITHRLSTVKNCDRIFFIDKGKIAKQGTAAEVLKDI